MRMGDAPTQPRTNAGGGADEERDTLITPPEVLPEAPIKPSGGKVTRPGDRIFSTLATSAAGFITVIIAAIGVFLIWRAIPALQRNQTNFLTSREWNTTNINDMAFGVLDLFQVTVFVSLFALLLAMPVALGIAIFISQYSPARIARPLAYVIDL